MKDKHVFRIFNEELRVVSSEGEEYLAALHDHIMGTIKRFDNVNSPFPMSYLAKALYASVFLADEMFKERRRADELAERVRELESMLPQVGIEEIKEEGGGKGKKKK